MDVQAESSLAASRPNHRTSQVRSQRYEPTPVYAIADDLKRKGLALHKVRGPWHPIRRQLRRAGRNAEKAIAIVTNGVTEFVVDTAERAAEVSGLLNWCGINHLQPVPNLRPPVGDLA